jgi:hypothetical protein
MFEDLCFFFSIEKVELYRLRTSESDSNGHGSSLSHLKLGPP